TLPFWVGSQFVEDDFESVVRDPGPIVADPALQVAIWGGFARPDDNLAARGIPDRIRNQVLKYTLEKARVRVCREILGDLVNEPRAGSPCQRMQVVDKSLDKRPEIELATLQLDARLRRDVIALFENLFDQGLQMLHVAVESFQHLGRFSAGALPRGREFQHARGEGNGVQRSAKVVRYKGQILFPSPLHFERLLSGKRLDSQADRLIQDAVQDV